MDKKLKECTKPHSLAHSLTGLGVGLILVSYVPALMDKSLIVGVAAVVVGIIWDYSVNK